jgi:hypothetical protein
VGQVEGAYMYDQMFHDEMKCMGAAVPVTLWLLFAFRFDSCFLLGNHV